MTVIDWSERPEPWRTIGGKFSAKLPALCGDPIPPPPPRQVLVGLIAQRRKKLGLKQRELGLRAGCSQSEISAYEKGRVVPSKAMRERLAAILLPEPPPPSPSPSPDLHDAIPAREAASTER